MSHRQRDTHAVTVYHEVDAGTQDSLGDAETTTEQLLETEAYVRDYARASAGGTEARDAGETPLVEKEVSLTDPAADTIEEGMNVTLTRLGESTTADDPVFVVTRIVEDNALRGGRGPWRLTIDRVAGATKGDL